MKPGLPEHSALRCAECFEADAQCWVCLLAERMELVFSISLEMPEVYDSQFKGQKWLG